MKLRTSQLVDRALHLADIANTDFLTHSELNAYLNDAWQSVYQTLINKGDKAFVKEVELMSTSGIGDYVEYELPEDLYQVLSLKHKYSGSLIKRHAESEAINSNSYEIINDKLRLYGVQSQALVLTYWVNPKYLSFPDRDIDVSVDGDVLSSAGDSILLADGRIVNLKTNDTLGQITIDDTKNYQLGNGHVLEWSQVSTSTNNYNNVGNYYFNSGTSSPFTSLTPRGTQQSSVQKLSDYVFTRYYASGNLIYGKEASQSTTTTVLLSSNTMVYMNINGTIYYGKDAGLSEATDFSYSTAPLASLTIGTADGDRTTFKWYNGILWAPVISYNGDVYVQTAWTSVDNFNSSGFVTHTGANGTHYSGSTMYTNINRQTTIRPSIIQACYECPKLIQVTSFDASGNPAYDTIVSGSGMLTVESQILFNRYYSLINEYTFTPLYYKTYQLTASELRYISYDDTTLYSKEESYNYNVFLDNNYNAIYQQYQGSDVKAPALFDSYLFTSDDTVVLPKFIAGYEDIYFGITQANNENILQAYLPDEMGIVDIYTLPYTISEIIPVDDFNQNMAFLIRTPSNKYHLLTIDKDSLELVEDDALDIRAPLNIALLRYGPLVSSGSDAVVKSHIPDTELNFPNEIYYSLIAADLAVRFAMKQNIDATGLQALYESMWITFMNTLSQDAGYTRIRNEYR